MGGEQRCAHCGGRGPQFCGHDPDTLVQAAQLVVGRCDAVDINLGCPQGIAKRGHYGAFLLEHTQLLRDMVTALHTALPIPVTCKIRLLPTDEDTDELVDALVESGCQLLTVHGRTRVRDGRAVRPPPRLSPPDASRGRRRRKSNR